MANKEPIQNAKNKQLAISLVNATKRVKNYHGFKRELRAILNDVTLEINSGEFIGLLGASGSGKSTLIKSIAGLIELSEGEVSIDGVPYKADELRRDGRIAYMPQDVVIHEQLTPRSALMYSAKLKGLGASRKELIDLIQKALERVGLGEHINTPIERLSGGQRKRVALASELLGNPQVILLDEATSGLDPASESEMMVLFRSLADEGRTIICITHFPNRLAMCDRLIYIIAGEAVFFGKPTELVNIFQVEDIESVYRRQGEQSASYWKGRFLATPTGKSAFNRPAPKPVQSDCKFSAIRPPVTWAVQSWVQFSRYLAINFRDLGSLSMLIFQAPIIAAMVALVFGWIRVPFAEQHAASTKELCFVLVIAVLWCSGTLSVRELVKERTVFRHESRFGISVSPYIMSKLLFLGSLAVLQACTLLAIVRAFTGLTGNVIEQVICLSLTAFTGVTLGLVISAASPSAERAMTVLPVLLIAQAVFSSGLARLDGFLLWFSRLTIPAYWTLDGLRASFSTALTTATYPGAPGSFQPPILGSGGPQFVVIIALLLQTTVILLITAWLVNKNLRRTHA